MTAAVAAHSLHHRILVLRPRLARCLETLSQPPAAAPSLHHNRLRRRGLPPVALPVFAVSQSSLHQSTAAQDAAQSLPAQGGAAALYVEDAASAVDVNPPRGTRDFPPEEMRLRNWLFQSFREVSRLLSFEEVDFPVLESEALFIRKAGEEITQQAWGFEDQIPETETKHSHWLAVHANLQFMLPINPL